MAEKVTKRDIFVTSFVCLLIILAIFTKELPTMYGTPNFTYYIAGKISVITVIILYSVAAIFDVALVFLFFPYLVFWTSLIYICHGQYFQPNYWLAYMEFIMFFPMSFNLEKHVLAPLLASGVIIFNIVFFYCVDLFVQKGSYTKEFYYDAATGTVITTVFSFMASGLLMSEKFKQVTLYQRFIDLGKNMSSIAHDIKGMISGPCTYVDLLSELSAKKSFSEKDIQLITYLKEDVYAIRDFVLEMNNLVSTHITDTENIISISAVIRSIRKIFKSKIKNIKIYQVGDLTLSVKIDYINRILINLIVNSCEAINKNAKQNGRITIYCEDNLLGVADNSGEQLDKRTLKMINSGTTFFTNKKGGSGLGVMIIRDYVNLIGGNEILKSCRGSEHGSQISKKDCFEQTIGRSTVKEKTEDPVAYRNKILIADDDTSVSRALGIILEEYGDIEITDSGNDAIALLNSRDYDVVVTDQEMVNGTGLDIIIFLKKTNKNIPVILITAFGTKELLIKTLQYQIFSVIEKPFQSFQVRQEIEKALKAVTENKRLAKLAEIGTAAGEMIHEISNPLTILNYHIERLAKIEAPEEPIVHRPSDGVLFKLKKSLDRITNIVSSTKATIRGDEPLLLTQFTFSDVLRDAKEEYTLKAENQKVTIGVEGDFEVTILADRNKIRQIIVNLINNAIDATLSSPEKWVKLSIDHDSCSVRLKVTDSGRTMSEEVKKKLFQMFFSTKGKNGTGLGLGITKKYARSHGGDVNLAETVPNTQFELTLPISTPSKGTS